MKQFLKNVTRIFWLPTIILLYNYTPKVQELMDRGTGFDKLVHAAGGAAIAYSTIVTLHIYGNRWSEHMPKFVKFIFIVAIVALAGVSWEVYEFISDTMHGVHQMQPSIADTMGDLIADILFGALFALVFVLKRKKSRV